MKNNKKYITVNLNTKGGAKAFLKDLQKELPTQLNKVHSQVQGFKSKYYHQRRIKIFMERLEAGDKDVVKDIRKYATRQGKHKKVVDVYKQNNKWVYRKEISGRIRRQSKKAGINSFYDFVERWDEIQELLTGMGVKDTPLSVFMFGIGRTYELWRERLSSFLGCGIAELIQYLNWAKECYMFRTMEIKSNAGLVKQFNEQLYEALEMEEDDYLINELQQTINHLYIALKYWADMWEVPAEKPEYYSEILVNFMERWASEPAIVGGNLINMGW